MSRLGYICDGCGDEHHHRDPAGVRKEDGKLKELCPGCYEDYWDDGE